MPVLKILFGKTEEAPTITQNSEGVGEWFASIYGDFIEWFRQLAAGEPFQALAYLSIGLVIVTVLKNVSRFLAMNFTGSTPFTSLSGVKKELRRGLPLQIGAAALAFLSWAAAPFL